MATKRAGRPRDSAGTELLLELAYTYFRLRAEGDRRARRVGQSTGRLGVLRSLADQGPRTVAQIARSRPVARQGVQRLADALAAEGFVEYLPNPDHRRSKLLRLTPQGAQAYHALRQGQRAFAEELTRGLPDHELHRCTAILRTLRARLASFAEQV
jgi:DNA-binding MarR family transcriptional regulator